MKSQQKSENLRSDPERKDRFPVSEKQIEDRLSSSNDRC